MEVKTSKNEKKIIAVSAVVFILLLVFISVKINQRANFIKAVDETSDQIQKMRYSISKEDICGTWESGDKTFVFGEDNSYVRKTNGGTVESGSYEIDEDWVYLDAEERTNIRVEVTDKDRIDLLFLIDEGRKLPLLARVFGARNKEVPLYEAIDLYRTGECGEEVNGG